MAMKFGKVANNAETEERDYAPAIQMGIEHAPTKLIVKYITDMYARPLDAALRETVSNALDAACAAGKDANCVKVSLDEDSGVFSVKDGGAGMGYDKLVNVYTQYGVSDKRDDGATTGAFGLGAKSPLAYTNEFTVVTKTKEDGCLFLRAYRTSEDDFIADLPRKVEGLLEVTYYRDWQDNVMAPLADAKGNPIAPEDGYEHTDEIVDPFEEGETGTVVSFEVSRYHIDDAKGVLDSMERTLFLSGDGAIGSHDFSKSLPYFCLGEQVLADDDGDEATMRVLAPSAPSKYTAQSVLSKLSCIFDAGSLTQDKIGFKVGNWVYPANGNIWSDDYSPTLLVDVPSKVLPFVPSRDAIRHGAGNSNAVELLHKARELVVEFCEKDSNVEDLVNWGTSMTGDFVSCAHALLPQPLEANLDAKGRISVWSEDGTAVRLDSKKLIGFGSHSLAELIGTPNIVAGLVDTPKSYMRNAGVYVASNCDLSRIMGGKAQVASPSGEVCRNLPGYAIAKKKTVADNVSLGKPSMFGEQIDLAASYENDASKKACNILYSPRAGYPAGLALMNLAGIDSRKPVCLIDASRCGIRKARMGIVDIVENSEAAKGWSSCTYFLVPPAADGSAVAKEQMEKIVSLAEELATESGARFTYVPADKVSEMSRKSGPGKMKSSELEKMFSNCKLVNRYISYDEDGTRVRDALETAWRGDKRKMADAMNENPTAWGIVVASAEHSDSLAVSEKFARSLLAMEMVPEYIEHVVCMNSRNFSMSRAAMCVEAGAMVLFDESGKASSLSCFTTDTVSLHQEGKYLAGAQVVMDVAPTAEYLAVRNRNVVRNSSSEFTSLLNAALGIRWTGGLDSSRFSPKWVETITCGREKLPVLPLDENVGEIPDWKKSAFAQIAVNARSKDESGDFASEYEKQVASVQDGFANCAKLWGWCLDSMCLSIKLDKMSDATLDKLAQIADAIGVESCIDSLYAGVPMEDIMA